MLDQSTVIPLVEAAFGRWAMVVPDKDWLRQARITHEQTIAFLSAVGLPVQCALGAFADHLTRRPQTLREYISPELLAPAIADHFGASVVLGVGAQGEYVYLDPETGRVYGFINFMTEPYVYNSSISHLVYFAAYFELHSKVDGLWLDDYLQATLDDEGDAAWAAATAIGRHFAEVDPAACQPLEDSFWQAVAEEGFASGLYKEWAWDRSSIEYFHARGINPTVLQPRRPLKRHATNPWAGADAEERLSGGEKFPFRSVGEGEERGKK